MFGFVLIRRLVAQSLVKSRSIVKRFDVLEHTQPGIFQRFILVVLRPFVFELPEEPFGDRIVVAVAAAARKYAHIWVPSVKMRTFDLASWLWKSKRAHLDGHYLGSQLSAVFRTLSA